MVQQSNKDSGKHMVKCQECKNDIELQDKAYTVGDTMECPYCGTTYEVVSTDDSGLVSVDIVEEEK